MDEMPPAIFLIGHGTRSPEGTRQLHSLAREVSAVRPDVPSGIGIIEHSDPDLDSGMEELIRAHPEIALGERSVVAVPLVLLGAGHMKDDGPMALSRARSRHPGLRATYATALAIHPLLLEVATERIARAGGTSADAVILVGRGSTDPDANADLYKVARLLADRRGLGTSGKPDALLGEVEPAFVSLSEPSVPSALERAARLGATSIVVVPYFLFHGVLIDRIADQVHTWCSSQPSVQAVVGRELYPDERLGRLIWHRYDQARDGTASMNCDCCVYRAPLPGHPLR
jgi:cobalt/nickel transport system ATP-binding protein